MKLNGKHITELPRGRQYLNQPLSLSVEDLFSLSDGQRQALHELIEKTKGRNVVSFNPEGLK